MAQNQTLYEAAGKAMTAGAVRDKQRQVADRIAGTARALATAQDAPIVVGRSSGVRPKGRPFERVTATSDSEWGTRFAPRRRILSRAAALSARTGGRRRR